MLDDQGNQENVVVDNDLQIVIRHLSKIDLCSYGNLGG